MSGSNPQSLFPPPLTPSRLPSYFLLTPPFTPPYPLPSSHIPLNSHLQDRRPQPKPPLDGLPYFNNGSVNHHSGEDNAPFPSNGIVLKHDPIDNRQVDNRKGNDKPSRNSAKQKLVLPDGTKHRGKARVLFGMHIEQRASKVLSLPRSNQQQKGQRSKRRSARAEGNTTNVVKVLVAPRPQPAGTGHAAVGDAGEGSKTQAAHGGAVDELVDDELAGEDADGEIVGRALHDVGLGVFDAEAEGQEGRGDEVGPEDLERGEREDGDTVWVFEGEADEEEEDLGDVGDEEVEEKLGGGAGVISSALFL